MDVVVNWLFWRAWEKYEEAGRANMLDSILVVFTVGLQTTP